MPDATDPSCLFCRIVAGDVPAAKVHEDELVVAIEDVNPVAPVHQLLMPRHHVRSVALLTDADAPWLGRLFAVAAELAAAAELPERGYRLVANTGADGGQSVPHLHFHLLGGRAFAWPPG